MYTVCHWATIDINCTINRNPFWNGPRRGLRALLYKTLKKFPQAFMQIRWMENDFSNPNSKILGKIG